MNTNIKIKIREKGEMPSIQSCCQFIRKDYALKSSLTIDHDNFVNNFLTTDNERDLYNQWLEYIQRCNVKFKIENGILSFNENYSSPLERYYSFIMWRFFFEGSNNPVIYKTISQTLEFLRRKSIHKRILSPLIAAMYYVGYGNTDMNIAYHSRNITSVLVKAKLLQTGEYQYSMYAAPKLSDIDFTTTTLNSSFYDSKNELIPFMIFESTRKYIAPEFKKLMSECENFDTFYKKYINLKPIT